MQRCQFWPPEVTRGVWDGPRASCCTGSGDVVTLDADVHQPTCCFFRHVSAAQQTFPKYTLCTRPWAGYWGPTEVKVQALVLESSLQKNKQCGALDPLSIMNPFVKLMKSYDLLEKCTPIVHANHVRQVCMEPLNSPLTQLNSGWAMLLQIIVTTMLLCNCTTTL